MAAIIQDTDELHELDAGTKEAWRAYSERLRDLTGAEYEHAEAAAWDELQRHLRKLERRRKLLRRELPDSHPRTA